MRTGLFSRVGIHVSGRLCYKDTIVIFQMPEESNTLPTLFRNFKKPKQRKQKSKPTQRFRQKFISKSSWEMGVCDLSVLHAIVEEDEEDEEESHKEEC